MVQPIIVILIKITDSSIPCVLKKEEKKKSYKRGVIGKDVTRAVLVG